MKTTEDEATVKARRTAEGIVEALNFDIKENRRQMVVDIERHHELMQRRDQAVRLLRMLGGEAAPFSETEAVNG